MIAVAVNCLVTEARRKSVRASMGRRERRSRKPYPREKTVLQRRRTMAASPGASGRTNPSRTATARATSIASASLAERRGVLRAPSRSRRPVSAARPWGRTRPIATKHEPRQTAASRPRVPSPPRLRLVASLKMRLDVGIAVEDGPQLAAGEERQLVAAVRRVDPGGLAVGEHGPGGDRLSEVDEKHPGVARAGEGSVLRDA